MRFLTKIFGVVLIFSCYVITAQSKPRVWDTRDGLSNNWISDIFQDDEGYIWLATQYGLNRFDGYSFVNYTNNPEDENSLVANWVKRIERKSKNELWLGIEYGGLDLYNTTKKEFKHKAIIHEKDTIISINKLLSSKDNHLYIAANRGLFKKENNKENVAQLFDGNILDIRENSKGQIFFLSQLAIYRYDPQLNSYQKVFDNLEKNIVNIFIDSEDRLYALKNNELLFLQLLNGAFTVSNGLHINQLGSLRFADTPIFEDSQHRIWIGCEKGITIIDKTRGSSEFQLYISLFEKEMVGVQALSFFEDIHKNMWIGTNKGVALVSTFSTRFQATNLLSLNTNINDIRDFSEVNKNLLMASNEGLFRSGGDKSNQRILSDKIYGMHISNSGSLYAVGHGFFEIDTTTFKATTKSNSFFKAGWSIAEDTKGNLWTIKDPNLVRYRKDLDTFETFDTSNIPTLKDIPRVELLIDTKGRLWLCTLKSGVYILENPQDIKLGEIPVFQNINFKKGDKKSLSHGLVTSLLEASDGTIWVGTDAGLNAVDPITFEVKRYLKKDGLKDEKIMALVEDDYGNIWGSTIGNGIFHFNEKTEIFNFISQEDGLRSSNFLLSSVYKNNNGILFFGTDSGFEAIDPSLFRDFVRPKIDFFFTHIALPSKSSESQIKSLVSGKNKIMFDHDENSFSINYTTLNYHLAEKTKYRYKVKNLNDTWQNNGSARSIPFNSLAPGNYKLEVAAINPDLDFTSNLISIDLTIRPPWWRTNLAYAAYTLLFLFLLFATHKFLLKRRLDVAETNRLQELDTFKTNFFTNVAHELKTPLTLISGMANNLRKKGNKQIKNSANTILRNSNELNNLVSQIMDLSKLEIGKLDLNLAHGDIIAYLKYIMSSYESLASAKEIRLHFLSETEVLHMDFDPNKLKHIFSNLISNAIKNTPVKGDIYFQVNQDNSKAIFVVKDNGIGISKEDIRLIFDRYYQAQGQLGGTGIGLSFTKELVELMNGSISVVSKLDKGSSFEVILPIEHKVSKPISYLDELTPISLDTNGVQPDPLGITEELPLIQIIDDNLDICAYLGSILKQDYRLNFDYAGDSGLKNVLETLPDFVITDLMMPGKDGFEVCNEIKSNPITNHIPVIILTAKSDAASKLQGLKFGADVYLEKPFDEKELTIRISKLLKQRETLREKYRDPDFWENTTNKNEDVIHEFVSKVRKEIENNLDDTSFGILELCRALGISRSNLHRKLKALTDLSTSAFIQTVKLQKARQLLKASEKNVSEVAYEVGFEDPAYFSRLFSKTFGYPPSETRKNH